MNNIQYLTDTKGKKTGIVLNISDNLESKILDFWLKEPDEKRNLANLYFAKFLHEISTDIAEKKELDKIINEIESIAITSKIVKSSDFIAYTIKGKGLTKQEFSDIILKASDEAHAGINLIEHNEVVARINKKIKSYESNMAK
jgi:hypothetical protein